MWAEALAEDCLSLNESAPYVVRYHEHGAPIRCECCGTMVAQMPEALITEERPRRWKPGIWETEAGRRHTLRRCEWMRQAAA